MKRQLNLWVKRFYIELKFLVDKINKIIEFNTFSFESEEISRLDEQLKSLKINLSDLDIFKNQKVMGLVSFIDEKIKSVMNEVGILKNEMGELKHSIDTSEGHAIKDLMNSWIQQVLTIVLK